VTDAGVVDQRHVLELSREGSDTVGVGDVELDQADEATPDGAPAARLMGRPASWRPDAGSPERRCRDADRYAVCLGIELSARTWPSWLREAMSSLEKTLRRW
jgi:hypothetical protein